MTEVELPSHLRAPRAVGEGAFGRVYRAETPDGRAVAVKVLARELADRPEEAWRFTSEYHRLARLEHPAFPAAVEQGLTPDGRPYYAMAFVAGRAAEDAAPLPAAEVRRIVRALAGALDHLHGRGWIHGDLKPENVVLDEAGGVHLLDVGMLAPIGQPRAGIAGTPAYMAPAVWRRAPADPSDDLYALGALAQHLWAGAPPFAAPGYPSPADLVRGHLQDPPPPPPAGDPELAALIGALLAKDAGARPASALAVAAALGEAVEPGRLAAAAGRLRGGGFVGREAPRAAWDACLAAAGEAGGAPADGTRDGAAEAWLVVTGAPGLGKSRLLDELRVAAQLAGFTWVGAATVGGGPGAWARAVTRQALAAAGLAPAPRVAAWLAGDTPADLADLEPAARRAALHAAAAGALADAAGRLGGLAIGIDDAHALDATSAEWLAAARRAGMGAPLAMAAAGEAPPPVPGLPAAEALAPWTDAEAAAHLAARLGEAPGAELLAAVVAPAAGNPQLIDLTLEHFAAAGALRREPGGWRLDAAGAGVSGGLAAIWARRLADLPPAARALGAALAVALPAGEVPVAIAAAALAPDAGPDRPAPAAGTSPAAGIPPAAALASDAGPALDALAARGLVIAAGGRARMRPGPAADALRAELGAAGAAALATRLARALVGGSTPDEAGLAALATDVLVPAARVAATGADDGLAHALTGAAGLRALALAAPAEARGFLDVALARLPADTPGTRRLALTLARAEAARFVDQPGEAIADYEAAIALAEAAGDGAAEVRARIGLGKCRSLKGDLAGAVAQLEAAEARAEAVGDRGQQVRAIVSEGRLRLFRGEPDLALACGRRAIALARAIGSPALLAQALNLHGLLLTQLEPARIAEAVAAHEEARGLSAALGDRVGEVLALDNLGNAHLTVGALGPAQAAFAEGGAVARAIGSETDALTADLQLTIVAGERGDGARARDLAADVVRRAAAVGRRFPQAVVKATAGQAAWRAGRPAEALPALDEAVAIAADLGNKVLEEHVRAYRLEALLALGRAEAAAEEAARVAALIEATGHVEGRGKLACLEAEARRLTGSPADPEGVLPALARGGNQLTAHRACQVLALAALAQAEAASAPAAARPHAEAARGWAREARAIADAWDAPWHQAHDAWLEARAALAAGEPAAATALAREAARETADPNHYARVGAALVLAAAGDAQAARPLLAEAAGALGLAALDEAGRAALLAAWDLQALPAAAEAPRQAHVGLAVDPVALGEWIAALARAEDEAELGDVALAGAIALVGADRGYVLTYVDGRLVQAVTRAIDYETELAGGFSASIAGRALFSDGPVYVVDASSDAELAQARSVMALGLRTVVALPLLTPGDILGVLYVDREAIDPVLGEGDLALLGAYASAVALALSRLRERARWHEDLAVAERTTALGRRLAAALDAPTRRRALLAEALAVVGADRALWLERPAGGRWRATDGLDRAGRATAGEFSQGVASWVAEREEPLGILDTGEDDAWQERRSVQALGLRTVWCLPAGPDALLYLDAQQVVATDPGPALRGLAALAAVALGGG